MKQSSRLLILVVTAGALLLAVGSQRTQAQDSRSLYWQRWDTRIDHIVTASNSFDVTETYDLYIEAGPYWFGFREIPTDRLTGIENVQVSQDGTAFTPGCSQQPATFCVTTPKNAVRITYYFRRSANRGDEPHVVIKYTVRGALRSYPDGDQLYWSALAPDRAFPVYNSTVTVQMPEGRPPQVVAGYASDSPDWRQTVSGSTITWTAPGNLGKNGNVEVRVQYPHDPQMAVPPWQPAFDRQRQLEQVLGPVAGLGGLALAVLLGIGGPLLIYTQYARRGRDPEPVIVPEYLTEPPSNDPPGVVGTLVDETADMQDIMATLIDLARRGFIVIEQTATGGLFSHVEFIFHRTDQDTGQLYPYEQALLRGIFSGYGNTTRLSDLRNKFYTKIPAIKTGLYREVVRNGYFSQSPDTTRSIWTMVGIAILVVAGLVGYGAYTLLWRLSPLAVLPAFGLGLTGLAALIAANYMPAKTPKGSQEAARWRAFRTYLQNIKKYADLQQASDQFERYIAYAVAFGLDRQWLHTFTPVLTSMPSWYYPTYLGGPWHGGYRGGYRGGHYSGQMQADMNLGGSGGLNQMSQSLTDGLNAMSAGLTRMLNDASSIMTSHPSSSGSGGFSGGGSSGGGSSGGGSAGFG